MPYDYTWQFLMACNLLSLDVNFRFPVTTRAHSPKQTEGYKVKAGRETLHPIHVTRMGRDRFI